MPRAEGTSRRVTPCTELGGLQDSVISIILYLFTYLRYAFSVYVILTLLIIFLVWFVFSLIRLSTGSAFQTAYHNSILLGTAETPPTGKYH